MKYDPSRMKIPRVRDCTISVITSCILQKEPQAKERDGMNKQNYHADICLT